MQNSQLLISRWRCVTTFCSFSLAVFGALKGGLSDEQPFCFSFECWPLHAASQFVSSVDVHDNAFVVSRHRSFVFKAHVPLGYFTCECRCAVSLIALETMKFESPNNWNPHWASILLLCNSGGHTLSIYLSDQNFSSWSTILLNLMTNSLSVVFICNIFVILFLCPSATLWSFFFICLFFRIFYSFDTH